MTNPVFVIHGVGNKGRQEAFDDLVTRLSNETDRRFELIPVYWGDLAANDKYIGATVPSMTESRGPREDDGSILSASELLSASLPSEPDGQTRAGAAARAVAVDAAIDSLAAHTSEELRSALDDIRRA